MAELSLDKVVDGFSGVDGGDDDLLDGDVVPVVLFAVLDEDVAQGDMSREEVAVLRVVVGDKGAADVKGAGCSDGVEEESLDEAVGFRGCRRRGGSGGAGQTLSGVVRFEWETSEKVCLQSLP